MASAHFGVERPVELVAGLPATCVREPAGEGLDRDLMSLYEQLLATRVDFPFQYGAGQA